MWHRIDDPDNPPPKDGTCVLITDGVVFTRAYWWIKMEPEFTSLGYGDPDTWIPNHSFSSDRKWSSVQVKNPKFGEVDFAIWLADNPVAFIGENRVYPDYDGNFDPINPTHWAHMPPPPAEDTP